jgi:hypothetical protein
MTTWVIEKQWPDGQLTRAPEDRWWESSDRESDGIR